VREDTENDHYYVFLIPELGIRQYNRTRTEIGDYPYYPTEREELSDYFKYGRFAMLMIFDVLREQSDQQQSL